MRQRSTPLPPTATSYTVSGTRIRYSATAYLIPNYGMVLRLPRCSQAVWYYAVSGTHVVYCKRLMQRIFYLCPRQCPVLTSCTVLYRQYESATRLRSFPLYSFLARVAKRGMPYAHAAKSSTRNRLPGTHGAILYVVLQYCCSSGTHMLLWYYTSIVQGLAAGTSPRSCYEMFSTDEHFYGMRCSVLTCAVVP